MGKSGTVFNGIKMNEPPYQSFFSYELTRPYPFRWFTFVASIGFLGFTALFSYLNFVSTGSTLTNEVSRNPHRTIADNKWFPKWPSFLTDKFQPTCQTLSLPVNSEFFTSQNALTYTLTSVWRPATTPQNMTNTIAPSLAYYDNVLENCTIWSIEVDLEAMDRSANQFAYAEWGATVRSHATCAISGENGVQMFNLTQEYDYVPTTISFSGLYEFLGSAFIARDKMSRASLWWGESLLSTYWALLTMEMQQIRQNDTLNVEPAIRKGTLLFTRSNKPEKDITAIDFFQVDYRFIVDTQAPPGDYKIIYPGLYDGDDTSGTKLSRLVARSAYPNIWGYADDLAKSAYSTILADLGQVTTSPNILTNASALQYFTANFKDNKIGQDIANAQPGPATADYSSLKDTTGPLNLTTSTINAQYLCQVPQRKSTGNLLVSILLADLVFLQTLWRLFRFVVDHFLLKSVVDANKCVGCASVTELRSGYRALYEAR
ncbi:MAG: hypothetical protein Q9227_009363 [Pyrenula ochraceoflavens]